MSNTNETQPQPAEETTFFQALFDFKFTEWVTLRVAGALYLISIILVSLLGLLGLISLIVGGAEGAFIALYLIIAALSWIFLVLLLRLAFEASIATIAVAQNTASLRK
jgi:hypothetical protein